MSRAKRAEVVVGEWPTDFQGPILSTGSGFCTDIQNQLAVLTGFGQAEGKMGVDLPLTYGGEQRGGALHKHTCISFVEHSLYEPICQSTLDRPVGLSIEHFMRHLL